MALARVRETEMINSGRGPSQTNDRGASYVCFDDTAEIVTPYTTGKSQ